MNMTFHGFRIHFEPFISVLVSLPPPLSSLLSSLYSQVVYNASVLLFFQTQPYPRQASDAEMASAAVFPFIYCHALDTYLYSFPQNTNWFNCYNHQQISRVLVLTAIHDNILLDDTVHIQCQFINNIYTLIHITWCTVYLFI